MSVYIPKNAKHGTYSYCFDYKRGRFQGSTGKTTRRDAEREEARIKEQVKTELARAEMKEPEEGQQLTFEQALARYWEERGQHHANSSSTLRNLEWLRRHFGTASKLADIDDGAVAAMVAKRRGEKVANNPKKYVSNATVNHSVIRPLREIIIRARDIWGVSVRSIKWGKHLLKEPKERVRSASVEEEQAIMKVLDRGYDAAVRFSIQTGARRMEILGLRWTDVDFFNDRVTLHGKGDKVREIPLSAEARAILWAQKDNHPSIVFTYIAKKTRRISDGRLLQRGKRYPLTAGALETQWQRATKAAGIQNLRVHDMRHTAATRLLRSTGNLRMVQRLLGHEDIETTLKYAHLDDADLRAGLEKVPVTEITKKAAG